MMAKTKSKSVAKKAEKVETPVEASLTTKSTNGTPYQLDPSQVERAAKALVAHMKKHAEEKEAEAPKKNLADDEDEAEESDQPIFLSLTTKSQIGNTKSMKPVAMLVLESCSNYQHIANRAQQITAPTNRERRPDMHLHQGSAKSLQGPCRIREIPCRPSRKDRACTRCGQAEEAIQGI
jgi:hypothetical protein